MDATPQQPTTQHLPSAEINVSNPVKQAETSQGSSLQHVQALTTNEFLES